MEGMYHITKGKATRSRDITKMQLEKEIELQLMSKPYSTAEEITISLGFIGGSEKLKEVLKDYIIDIVKNNKGYGFINLCRKYGLRADYVEELIDEGRIDLAKPNQYNLETMKNEQGRLGKEIEKANKIQELQQLSDSFRIKPTPTNNNPSIGYHSNIRRR